MSVGFLKYKEVRILKREKPAKKLDFSSEEKKNSKRMKYFIISFAAFIVVLGSISLLMFMKSLNFDLDNLKTPAGESTTEAASEQTSEAVEMVGRSNILFICADSDDALSFSFLIKSDMPEAQIKVYGISGDTASASGENPVTFAEHYKKFGAAGLRESVKNAYGIDIDRYVKVSDSQFKAFASKTGDVTVNIPAAVNTVDLSLDAGEQSLSGDLLLKYLKYCPQNEKNPAFCAFLATALGKDNLNSMDKLFSYLANNSETDISIVDYTNRKDEISAFISSNGSIVSVGDIANAVETTDKK